MSFLRGRFSTFRAHIWSRNLSKNLRERCYYPALEAASRLVQVVSCPEVLFAGLPHFCFSFITQRNIIICSLWIRQAKGGLKKDHFCS